VAKRGMRHNTEKHAQALFHVPGQLPGVHCQIDGEARFIFHPNADEFKLGVKRVMQIPVVLGPENREVAIGSSAGWHEVMNHDAGKEDAAFIPATSLDDCKELCLRWGFGGFCVYRGKAYYRAEPGTELKKKLFARAEATLYIRDEHAQAVQFNFMGDEDAQEAFKVHLRAWVDGSLASKLNATAAEVETLQRRSENYARGICARSQRILVHFGLTVAWCACAQCSETCKNRGCKGCRRTFCRRCLEIHIGNAPKVWWMYADAGVSQALAPLARHNNLRWSSELCLDDAIQDIGATADAERPILISIAARTTVEKTASNRQDACEWLRDFREKDAVKVSAVWGEKEAANNKSMDVFDFIADVRELS